MRIEFFGLTFETPCVTFYIWSPWRAAAIEHQIFKAIQAIPTARRDDEGDELRVHITDPKAWRAAVQSVSRVLKGWQEDAEMGSDRRSWRWLLEGDTNADGYDHVGEPVSLWGFLRLSLDRGSPGEAEKGEDIDLEGFGLRIWGDKPK